MSKSETTQNLQGTSQNNLKQTEIKTPKISTPKSAASKTFSFLFVNENTKNEHSEREHRSFSIRAEIEKEIEAFGKMIKDAHFINNTHSTTEFWRTNSEKFRLLLKVAAILLNISSSSAFVERSFSLCGIISTTRNANMKDELLIMRAMLKVNMSILSQMKTIHKKKV